MTDGGDAITAALKEECGAHLLDQVRAVVRCGAVDTYPDTHTSTFQIAHPAAA